METIDQHRNQRLRVRDVLRLYAEGERNFRGAILHGCNFRGADLSGVDFSGADIRGAWFVDAILCGTNFCHARIGFQRWRLTLGILLGVLAGLWQYFICVSVGRFFLFDAPVVERIVGGITGVSVWAFMFFVIAHEGFTSKAFKRIIVAAIIVVTIMRLKLIILLLVLAICWSHSLFGGCHNCDSRDFSFRRYWFCCFPCGFSAYSLFTW